MKKKELKKIFTIFYSLLLFFTCHNDNANETTKCIFHVERNSKLLFSTAKKHSTEKKLEVKCKRMLKEKEKIFFLYDADTDVDASGCIVYIEIFFLECKVLQTKWLWMERIFNNVDDDDDDDYKKKFLYIFSSFIFDDAI